MKILNPVETLKLSEEKSVEVRQMPFIQALQFTKKLSALAGSLFDREGKFLLTQASASGAMELNLSPLQNAIENSAELALFLIQHSTGKDELWIAKLSTAEGLTVLQKAIEMNLSKEILELGNGLAAFLGGLIRRKAPMNLNSSPLSIS